MGDIDISREERDIIVEIQCGQLQCISELHPAYVPLNYPLIFAYGEDGYRIDIPLCDGKSRKRVKLSIREFFAYRIMQRNCKASTLFFARKLF